jgi:hypothetical protein
MSGKGEKAIHQTRETAYWDQVEESARTASDLPYSAGSQSSNDIKVDFIALDFSPSTSNLNNKQRTTKSGGWQAITTPSPPLTSRER